jgi:hypothetical protein
MVTETKTMYRLDVDIIKDGNWQEEITKYGLTFEDKQPDTHYLDIIGTKDNLRAYLTDVLNASSESDEWVEWMLSTAKEI